MQCVMSTDPLNPFYKPGENHQCQRTGVYQLPMELGQYLPRVLVCKEHLSPFLNSYSDWIKIFKDYNIPKGIDLEDLQIHYAKQAIWSELS